MYSSKLPALSSEILHNAPRHCAFILSYDWLGTYEAMLGCQVLHWIVSSVLSLVWLRSEETMLILSVESPPGFSA